jgi:thiol-disulfide isomerase/thioredoxin
MKKIANIIALVPCLLAFLAVSGHSAEVGAPVPDFSVRTLGGNQLSRASLSGKPALLIFWNTWCATCKSELPKLNQMAEKFPGRLTVLAINTGLNDSESKARAYWNKYGYSFQSGYDHSFQVAESFRIMGVPTIVLVDAQGLVRYSHTAMPKDMEERLKQLVSLR